MYARNQYGEDREDELTLNEAMPALQLGKEANKEKLGEKKKAIGKKENVSIYPKGEGKNTETLEISRLILLILSDKCQDSFYNRHEPQPVSFTFFYF